MKHVQASKRCFQNQVDCRGGFTCVVFTLITAGKVNHNQLRQYLSPLIFKHPLQNACISLSYTRCTLANAQITGIDVIKQIKVFPRVLEPPSYPAAPQQQLAGVTGDIWLTG